MTVTLNGKPYEMESAGADCIPVSEFVSTLEIGQAPVLVELNGEAILTREFADHLIREGDTVEVIRMVAGG